MGALTWKAPEPPEEEPELDTGRYFRRADYLRIMTINCNGLRQEKKRLALGNISQILQIGICEVTESHLRRKELSRVKIPGYEALARFCRIASRTHIRGGVLILARHTVTAEEIESDEGDGRSAESWSIAVFPGGGKDTKIKVAGV